MTKQDTVETKSLVASLKRSCWCLCVWVSVSVSVCESVCVIMWTGQHFRETFSPLSKAHYETLMKGWKLLSQIKRNIVLILWISLFDPFNVASSEKETTTIELTAVQYFSFVLQNLSINQDDKRRWLIFILNHFNYSSPADWTHVQVLYYL